MSAFRGHDKKETTYPKSKFFNPCFNSQMKTNAEIRMRGFLKRTPVPELLELIRKHCRLNRSEQVELEHLGGRVLAEPIRSPLGCAELQPFSNGWLCVEGRGNLWSNEVRSALV
ncbi:MAG: hypothetical protein QGH65_04430 [SAR324 cluster bacterium]|nr:hypothetical protein [SAR324 cluster bacterium]